MRTTSLATLFLPVLLPVLVAACAAPADPVDARLGTQSSAVQGGSLDTKKAHSFAVGIASRYGAVCSGTLIAPNLVLTARHCVVPPDGDERVTCADSFPAENVRPSTLFVTTEPSLRSQPKFYAAKEITTPEDSAFCGNDIALITLTKNIPASEAVPATPVVQFSISDRSKISGQVTALGYGITSPNAKDSGTRRIRQDIDIVCVPGDESYTCDKRYAEVVDSEKEFVTAGYVCSGDSGGGAFDQVSFERGQPYVLGALSRGPQTDDECLAAIYSRTDAHAEMIIAAALKAARTGGYDPPGWVSPASTEDPELGTACEGDICTSTDATTPSAGTTITTTTTGCAAAPRKASNGTLALGLLAGLGAVLARRRRAR